MRLSESAILEGLLHPSQLVRQVVVGYFGRSYRRQVDITRKVVEAVETFGWQDVFEWPHMVRDFELDDALLPWVLDQFDRKDAGALPARPHDHLAHMVARAPIEVILPHVDQIFSMERFAESDTPTRLSAGGQIRKRIEISERSTDQCWDDLLKHCQDIGDVKSFNEARIDIAELLVDRIAEDGLSHNDEVCRILQQPDPDLDGPDAWQIGLMITLAGHLKIEAAVPHLFRQFDHDWDWYNEELNYAFVRIGTESVHRYIAEHYIGTPWYVRNFSMSAFEHIHTDTVVADILPLIEQEEHPNLRIPLVQAAASHFDDQAIDIARRTCLEDLEDPERLDIAERLIAHSELAGIDLPERDDWKTQIQSNRKAAQRRMKAAQGSATRKKQPHQFDDMEESYSSFSPTTIINESVKIGRNDLCPCNSGKKYKKCCLRKQADV